MTEGNHTAGVARAGVPVAPNGRANVRTRTPTFLRVTEEEHEARCGDTVEVTAALSDLGYDGVVDYEYRTVTGAPINTRRVAVEGHPHVVDRWVCRKGSATWGSDPDVAGTAILRAPDGREVSRAEMGPWLRIRRPPNVMSSSSNVPGATRTTPKWVRNPAGTWVRTGTNWEWRADFEVAFRDGAIYVIGRVRLVPVDGLVITSAMKDAWKREIEGYWSHKFRAHRDACGRGDACDCTHVCCHHDVYIVCDFVDHNEHTVVNVHPGAATGAWGTENWWFSNKWWERLSPQVPAAVRAHEFGHNIGLYDEYPGGGTAPGIDPNHYRAVTGSIMSNGNSPHAGHYVDWLTVIGRLAHDSYRALRGPHRP